MAKYHLLDKAMPMSRLLTFTEGCDAASVLCYLHTDDFAPQGWYDRVWQGMPLVHAFLSGR